MLINIAVVHENSSVERQVIKNINLVYNGSPALALLHPRPVLVTALTALDGEFPCVWGCIYIE